MTTGQKGSQPGLEAEFQEALRCLFASLVAEGQGPREALNSLYLAGFPPEGLVGFAHAAWPDSPSRHLAFIVLADAALEPGPMLAALRGEGFSELAARGALLARRPDWSRALLADWPSGWPSIRTEALEVRFSGADYRLPQGCLGGAHFVLEGGPRSTGLRAEHILVLRNLRWPSRLGLVAAERLQLEGCTSLPKRLKAENLTLRNSRLRALSPLNRLDSLTLEHASILRLPHALEAGVWEVRNCPRLRQLPRGWQGSMVLLENCQRLERIPKPTGIPLLITLQNLPRLTCLGTGSTYVRLQLERCGLRHLPRGLKVQRDLVVRNCPHLRALGRETEVGGDLVLEGVPALQVLPEDLVVHGAVRWSDDASDGWPYLSQG